MLAQAIQKLYDYNYWANHLILDTAQNLSEAQLNAPSDYSAGSVRQTLLHTLGGEWIWRLRCQEGVSPATMLNQADFPTLASLAKRWKMEEAAMRAFAATLTDENINRSVNYTTTEGTAHSQLLPDILQHLVLHGMQHRAELAAMLTGFGHSPGNIDFIVYLRRQKA